MRNWNECGSNSHHEHDASHYFVTWNTVVGAPAKIGADQIAKGTEDKDQADSFQSAGCVFGKRWQAGATRGGDCSHDDKGQVIRGCCD